MASAIPQLQTNADANIIAAELSVTKYDAFIAGSWNAATTKFNAYNHLFVTRVANYRKQILLYSIWQY